LPGTVAFALLLGTCVVAWPATAGAVAQPTHFIWTSPESGNSTLINNAATNGRPHAILFVTPNATPGGVCGCIGDNIPVGVFYDSSASEWGIFYEESNVTVQAGVSFNVLVVPKATSNVFTVTSSSSNISGDTVYINSPLTNSHPTTILQATQNGTSGGGTPIYNNNEVPGVWYNTRLAKWGVFNESGDTMASGLSFNILVGSSSSGGGKAKTLKANATNLFGNAVEFNNVSTNGDPNAFLLDTPNWDPKGVGGTYDTSETDVLYGGEFWDVINGDGTNMVLHDAFNILYWTS
jgi:hypothetical protein